MSAITLRVGVPFMFSGTGADAPVYVTRALTYDLPGVPDVGDDIRLFDLIQEMNVDGFRGDATQSSPGALATYQLTLHVEHRSWSSAGVELHCRLKKYGPGEPIFESEAEDILRFLYGMEFKDSPARASDA